MARNRFIPADDLTPIEFDPKTGVVSKATSDLIQQHIGSVFKELEEAARSRLGLNGDAIYVGTAGLSITFIALGDALATASAKGNVSMLQSVGLSPQDCYARASRFLQQESPNKRLTYLEGASGIIATRIRLLNRSALFTKDPAKLMELNEQVELLCMKLCETAKSSESLGLSECELLYGRAGVLYSLHVALSERISNKMTLHRTCCEVAAKIIESGIATAREKAKAAEATEGTGSSFDLPLIYEWHGKEYVGAAHGYIGILHTLILCSECFPAVETLLELPSGTVQGLVMTTLERILNQAKLPSGNLPSSLPTYMGRDELVHWCHGAPGAVLCLSELLSTSSPVKLAQHQRYTFHASLVELAEVVRERGCLRRLGLCHGLSGNGVALLQASTALGDSKYARRAYQYAIHGLKNFKAYAKDCDRPASLFEGLAGLAYLLVSLTDPQNSKFPGFSRMGVYVDKPPATPKPLPKTLESKA